MTTAVVVRRGVPAAARRSLCSLCGAALARASARGVVARAVCGGCAERLELELTASESAACVDCGRHRELCAIMPCGGLPALQSVTERVAQQPLKLAASLQRRRLSGAERVHAIEQLAATRLGIRELGRRTGFAPSTISRWLKIDRCPALKRALQTEALDIGRAKVLADAPQAALSDLIPIALGLSRADLARQVAAIRAQPGLAPRELLGHRSNSRRIERAEQLLESISRLSAEDRSTLERVRDRIDDLLGNFLR
jgi:hypothetical protein